MLKTILIATALTMATTSCFPTFEKYKPYKDLTSEDYAKFRETRKKLWQNYRESKIPEDYKKIYKEICTHDVFVFLEKHKREYKHYTSIESPGHKERFENNIKSTRRWDFIDEFVNTSTPTSDNLASIRGEYFEHLERQRKAKLCRIKAYEKLTGETI